MAGRIAVVDGNNRFVRWEDRRTIHEQRLVHRSIHVIVVDGQGRVLVQQRHRDKQTYPQYWDMSCAGHVEESDYPRGPDDELDAVYRAVALRELHEELGIVVADAELVALGRIAPVADVHYEHIALYRVRHDGPYTLQADEVEAIRMVTREELAALFADPAAHVTPALRYLAPLGLPSSAG